MATGVDLSAYNSVENAADFADLRAALGIDQWNVYGASYGTELALTFVRLHPEGIRTVTLDGIVPNDAITPGAFWLSAQEGSNSLFRACAAQPSCESRYPQIGSTFKRLVRELEADPITTRVKVNGQTWKVVLDGGTLVNWFVRIESNVEDDRSHLLGLGQRELERKRVARLVAGSGGSARPMYQRTFEDGEPARPRGDDDRGLLRRRRRWFRRPSPPPTRNCRREGR